MNNSKVCLLVLCCAVVIVLYQVQPAQSTRSRSRARSRSRSNSGSSRRRASSSAQATYTCKDRTTFNVTLDDLRVRPFVTQCPREPVVDLKAVAVRGDCRGTTASLRSTATRCEWNQTCSLKYDAQDDKMRSTEEGDYYLCTEQSPSFYEIQYNCLKRNVDVKHVLGQVQRTKKAYGIAKSHTLYPWSYRNGDQLGNLTFVKPRRPAGLSNLYITVRTLAIKDTDLVFLTWRDNSNPTETVDAVTVMSPGLTNYSVSNAESVTLTFFADYSRHRSEVTGPDQGFVLCYQWLSANSRLRNGSACTRVLQPGRCRSKRRRGTSNRRNRNRGSRRQRTGSRRQ